MYSKISNIGMEVYIYKPDGFNSLVVEKTEMVRNAKLEEFEEITLILSSETIQKYARLIDEHEKEEVTND